MPVTLNYPARRSTSFRTCVTCARKANKRWRSGVQSSRVAAVRNQLTSCCHGGVPSEFDRLIDWSLLEHVANVHAAKNNSDFRKNENLRAHVITVEFWYWTWISVLDATSCAKRIFLLVFYYINNKKCLESLYAYITYKSKYSVFLKVHMVLRCDTCISDWGSNRSIATTLQHRSFAFCRDS